MQQERLISLHDRAFCENFNHRFENSQNCELLCQPSGEIYDVNPCLQTYHENMQVSRWFKKNINDFNIRLIYDDNIQENFKNLEQLGDEEQVIMNDNT